MLKADHFTLAHGPGKADGIVEGEEAMKGRGNEER